jgi:peptide subunit release factor RF-3
MFPREKIRNIAIVAHVDHGKTTLVDHMLWQGGAFRSNEEVAERVMDSNDLEREKGITILAKNTAILWNTTRSTSSTRPATPTSAVRSSAVCAWSTACCCWSTRAEGPLPQTRFVLKKALGLGLQTVLVINKIDRKDARAKEILDQVYSLYIDLGAEEKDLEFPVIYAIAREGKASLELDTPARTCSRCSTRSSNTSRARPRPTRPMRHAAADRQPRLRRLRRPHRDRPHDGRPPRSEHARRHRARRRQDRAGQGREAVRLLGPQARRDRRHRPG